MAKGLLNIESTRLYKVPFVIAKILRVAKSYEFELESCSHLTDCKRGNSILAHKSGGEVFLRHEGDGSLTSINYYGPNDNKLQITGAYLRGMIRSLEVKLNGKKIS